MKPCGRSAPGRTSIRIEQRYFRLAPVAQAITVALAAGGAISGAQAQQAFSSAWFGAKSAVQANVAATGRLPNGQPVSSLNSPLAQQQQAAAQLQRSLGNLGAAVQTLAAAQAAQAAARQAAIAAGSNIPNGLGNGGLKVDTNSLTQGWYNANGPVQTVADGKTNVTIQQTADKAILNWETFNVGQNTIVNFQQQANWALLNRVNDPLARPSQIQGQIKADGTVMIVNRNGIVFSGSSQVDTRNLVAAAAAISDSQFTNLGLYGPTQSTASFTDANGQLIVEAGAQIATRQPASVTQGGGYVLLLGTEVSNAGQITSNRGQTQLVAGDSFIIRKGVGTDSNTASTTRGNEVAPQLLAGSSAGKVTNTGLIIATEGDVTLAGRDVQQNGVALATTSVNTRGTIHLLNAASDTQGKVTLGQNALTAILIQDDGVTTALNSQRDALAKPAQQDPNAMGSFDNLSLLSDRRDQSRIEIVSGGDVEFRGDSLTLATGGQIAVTAKRRTFVADRAQLDVSGAVGVSLAMESNAIKVNVQGNELRDAPGSRDSGNLLNANVWLDTRNLTYVPAGTGGYASDRWYAAGGLLEVSGYLGNQGHRIGEWAAAGGSITLGGAEVITQAGSNVNLSGGTLNVATGYLNQTWLKGSDGRLYDINNAPANLTYSGVYKGFEASHERWGKNTTEYYYNPFIAPQKVLTNGYTVGRDAGRLIISAPTAILEGKLVADVYNGPQQSLGRASGVTDSYKLAQNTVAQNGQLWIGQYGVAAGPGIFNSDVRFGDVAAITPGLAMADALPAARTGTVWLDAAGINAARLGGLDIGTSGVITIERAMTLADGARISLVAPVVDINADITARSGALTVSNQFTGSPQRGPSQVLLKNGTSSINLHDGVTLDLRGLWVNNLLNDADTAGLAYLNGGTVNLQSSNKIVLAQNSTIDVSSGAAITTKGKPRGGRGGNVAITVESQTGVLKLDGNVKGHGVNGGGTLTVSSGAGVGIGGKLLPQDGVLGAGQKAPVDLVLLQNYQVTAGDVLPVDYSFTTNIALPGESMGTTNMALRDVRLAADWTPPRPATGVLAMVIYTNIGLFRIEADTPLPLIPAGTVVSISQGTFPSSYVVPGNVFPNGLKIYPKTITIAAGNPAPSSFTVTSGTRVAAGNVFGSAVAVAPTTMLNTALMQSGFSSYDINGGLGLVVAAGTRLDVSMPVYRFTDAALGTLSGAAPALESWTPSLWTEDAANARLTQRGGASLTLRSSGGSLYGGGAIDIRDGAAISVDPGQAISLNASGGSITVDGALRAASGTITLNGNPSAEIKNGLIWIGDHAVLDVAGRAVTATDLRGNTYGTVGKGGAILIGGALDWEDKGEATAPTAFVVIRPGAVLDASGTSATLDIPVAGFGAGSKPITVASDGGTIVLKSGRGLYLDGTLRAAAGGANAAGGTLGLALATPQYPALTTAGGDALLHREFVMANVQGDSPVAGAISMDQVRAGLVTGNARVGVDRIHQGGFGNLSLLVDGPLSFDGDVTLQMEQSLRLYAGTFALSEQAAGQSRVALAAPYVRLAGTTRLGGDGVLFQAPKWSDGVSQQTTEGVFAVSADLIDLRDRVGFGTHRTIDAKSVLYDVDRRGFALVDLSSRGDIRLLAGLPSRGLSGVTTTELATTGSITLTAAQIYPASGVDASIVAGYNAEGDFISGSVLNIQRYGTAVPDLPYSAFGTLRLAAETVNQAGVVRAPFGAILFGAMREKQADAVNLLAGSITSVSGAGLLMPYGGTVDGLVYRYDGAVVGLDGAGGMDINGVKRGIGFSTTHLSAAAGAVLDLSGGGELRGAGFVSGRGGSVDILTTPLVNANPGNIFSRKGNTVYAIVPGHAGAYAPAVQEAGFGMPAIGRQITIADGVPGLPAGTYTLMPSSYALLPGAFRVELGAAELGTLATTSAIGNGSWTAGAYLGIANTAIRDVLPTRVTITPAATVRTYSSYNEMDYNAFVLADAARVGVPRAMQTVDAKTLDILLGKSKIADGRSQLSFNGELRINPVAASEGFGGTVAVRGLSEIMAPGQSADPNFQYASVYADDISKLNAPRLLLNGSIVTTYGKGGRFAEIFGNGNLVVRSGANIAAAEVILAGRGMAWLGDSGYITIEEGATISTVGHGRASYDSSNGFVFTGNGVLVLSNGWINLLQGAAVEEEARVNITVGSCISVNCNSGTRLVSEGSIAVATSGTFSIADNVSYGTRNLVLGLSAINLGENATLAAAAAAGRLPTGLALNQGILTQLLAGNTATGAPALETLVLNARDGVNMFGSTNLDASKVGRLVLGTPAIYGYGAAGDVATIRAGEFIWNGTAQAPGAAMADMLGDGSLNIAAKKILFGYGPNSQASTTIEDKRLALGFANVNFDAAERITANGKSSLAVYNKQLVYVDGEGYRYSGGNLNLATPLLTGESGSVNRMTAGGAIAVTGAGAINALPAIDALGATLELKGQRIAVDTAVVLPSGRLVLNATDDIVLGGSSRLDLAGRAVSMFDITKYSWGGDLVLGSSAGNIRQAAGSVIDLSAQHHRGGTLSVTALGAGSGDVNLGGTILGGASGLYDAGGTLVPYDAAEITVRAQTLNDFAALNQRLNTGNVAGARRFQIKQGDLTIGDEVQARNVDITLDGGTLTVNGRINASSFQVGSIRLAAQGNLTINGVLDAHGTGLRVDSYGKIIDSPNRAIVELTSVAGTLALAGTAAVDLRSGTDVTSGNDGAARGTLTLNAQRLGGSGVAAGALGTDGANDLALIVSGTPAVRGAKSIAVNAFRSYDAPLATVPDISGGKPQWITQAYLNDIDSDSSAFINAALNSAGLRNRLAGLGNYQLRPGVEIVSKISADNPHGDLSIVGDLDLSGYRYGPDANRNDPALRGFGAPGTLAIRAAGNLNVYGSINDGFAPPPTSATHQDENGWVLGKGVLLFGGDLVLPVAVTLDAGSVFKKGVTLNYDLPAAFNALPDDLFGNNVAAGTVLPVRAVLAGPLKLNAGTVTGAAIYNADGSVAYAAGTVLSSDVTLAADMQLGAGTVLRSAANIAALIWPKGVPLPGEMTSTTSLSLVAGSLLPSMTDVKLAGVDSVDLRPVSGGSQGQNWAVAPMLGAGASAWSMRLVAGADLGSADRRAVNPQAAGVIRLADTHYTSTFAPGEKLWLPDNWAGQPVDSPVDPGDMWYCDYSGQCKDGAPGPAMPLAPSFSVVRTGSGDLDLVAAGNIRMDSLYGVYTAGTATAVDPAYQLARGHLSDDTVLGPRTPDYATALAAYQAWYPDQGGNVLIAAGGDLIGDITGRSKRESPASVIVGNWLWRQGSGSAAVAGSIPTAWWINFGTYTRNIFPGGSSNVVGRPDLTGFTGIGALGGGNVTLRVGGQAGAIGLRGSQGMGDGEDLRSQGLVVAVGSTGRVGADGSLALTGGGDIDMRVAGALNPNLALTSGTDRHAFSGAVINLRGALRVAAQSVGGISLLYRSGDSVFDPRGIDPFVATSADARSGLTLVPGDAAAYVDTRSDLVLGGAGDPGRSDLPNRPGFSAGGVDYAGGGNSWFSLWTSHTAINLTSAGGNLTPVTASSENPYRNSDHNAADGSFTYPSILRAAALGGSMYYGINALPYMRGLPDLVPAFVTLAPLARGALEMLARDSIFGGQYAFSLSGAGTALPTPANPAFIGSDPETVGGFPAPVVRVHNGSPYGLTIDQLPVPLSLFVFGPNSAAQAIVRTADADPVRFYAREGDVVGLRTGETLTFPDRTWYNAGAPLQVRAGRDIVGAGLAPGVTTLTDWQTGMHSGGNLIVHDKPGDVSVIAAGRDIVYANFDVAGPGMLEMSAGRNLYQANQGSLTSIGAIVAGDKRAGANLLMQAGVGVNGPDYAGLKRYLDPANLLPPSVPLDGTGKVAKTYEVELSAWLLQQFGFQGSDSDARNYFATLKPEQQNAFLRQVYFAELKAGGREYNDVDSRRYGSYLRGRNVIAALFPQQDANANRIVRSGDITMFGGSGVRTNFGGDIQMLAPGGKIIVGVQGEVPPASAGVVTQGSGDIQLYSQGSVLLGLSRIMTTFGGDILAWSAEGDINAGRGSKTTVVYTPPKRVYDNYGNVTMSPQVPSTGAGIATLNPIAEVAPGDVDLIAPLGTIDAGEAGIRVSGNVNLAALQVVNAANVQVQGKSMGLPVLAAVNVAALTNASAASSQASNAAQDVMQRERAAARQALPSVVTVRVLGFGSEPAGVGDEPKGSPSRSGLPSAASSYDAASPVQLIGVGDKFNPRQVARMTAAERTRLQDR